MNVIFRTDASLQIGSGHVMRCLTLADELRQRGADVRFVSREHPGNLIALIEGKGYPVDRLPQTEGEYTAVPEDVAHASWLGVNWQQDAADTIVAMGETQPDWLIIDHYAIDCRWEQKLHPLVGKIMVIDDLADRSHDCDLFLNQNLGAAEDLYRTLMNKKCTLLMGVQYALLRPEFAALREFSLKRRQNPQFEKLLINMGGVDKDNVTGEVLNALKDCHLPTNCKILVVMGLTAPWLDLVRQQAKTLPWDVEVMVNVTDMAQLIANSDLAIGSAGSTSWERCCLGLPTIIVIIASNQKMTARKLEQAGAAILLDSGLQLCQLQSALQRIFLTPSATLEMVISSSKITDGKGVSTVSSYLMI